jgi:L-alanine-DL-glutamate epimerase-like enolase superfamily enzyme
VIIGDVRLVLADIPVRRPHTMSFTTLEAVNFVFVRIETRDGLIGWGEAACLGGTDLERGVRRVDRRHARALRDSVAARP